MAEKTKKKEGIKIRVNPWIISTLILLIILAILLAYPSMTGRVVSTDGTRPTVSGDEVANKAVDYINKYILAGQGTASFTSVEEKDGLYNIKLNIAGRVYDSYATMDGTLLFPSAVDLTETPELPEQQEQPTGTFDAPDAERPEVDLYVMSFCPFGKQAEDAMEPVIGLLGDKADIKIRFIANVQGDDVESVQSLHGIEEAKEDLRQICVMKNYDQETFWSYLNEINENCFSIYRDSEKMDACWKEAAEKFDIDIEKIETCAYGSEGLDLLKADGELTEQYGVSGSPTLIINGERYSGGRTPEAFKQGICSGFETEPEECSETLEAAAEDAPSTGGC